jgi:hypothetical protein
MKMMRRRIKIFVFLVVLIFVSVIISLYFFRSAIRDVLFELQKPAVPEPLPAISDQPSAIGGEQKAGKSGEPLSAETADKQVRKQSQSAPLPDQINLDVPFTPQAPLGVWDAFHEDACEEASALMVGRFWSGRPIVSAADAETELQAIGKKEIEIFGYNKDTNAEQTARFMQEFYGFKNVIVRYNISIDDIKSEVGVGRPVISPLYGRGPMNPYFRGDGPLYHMLVVKGYTKDGNFITNDPGTKRGKDYLYDEQYLFARIHDWNGGDVLNGQTVMIIVRPD